MKPWELDNYTLSNFINALEGYAQEQEEEWQRTRLQSYYIVMPNMKKGRSLKPKDLFTLPSDQKNQKSNGIMAKAYKLTPEEIVEWHAGKWVPPDERTDNLGKE